MNISQINFNCVFVFALATLNSHNNFSISNTIGIPTAQTTRQLKHIAYAVSCVCIAVSNAVVECVFSHITSVFKMCKSCDFECVGDRCQCCVILPVF